VIAEVDRLDAGLVVLAEVTPEALTRLRAAGLQRLLPHTAGRPAAGRAGLMVFTREPVADVSTVPGASAALQLRLGSGTPVTLIAAHAAQPLTEPLAWIRDSHALAAAARSAPDPVLLVGDLNATDDHAFVRRLLDAGLRDAAEVANSGWQPTWPGAGGLPLLRNSGLGALDHVLVGSGIGVVSTRTRVVHGTDHRMLVARLVR
jgi:endonuclease/exonuclease/phosphatase (EEP) superfamily protein YafD